jgi:VWFA-related protein
LRTSIETNLPKAQADIQIKVQFSFDPSIGMMVPSSMDEFYKGDLVLGGVRSRAIEAHATYQNFRRYGSSVRFVNAEANVEPPVGDLVPTGVDSYSVRVDVPVVTVDVWVNGSRGPVTDLKPDDFIVMESGVPQKITNFSPASMPFDVLLLFDHSGSTEKQWPLMRRALEGLIASLRPEDNAATATFASTLRMRTSWSDPRPRQAESLRRISNEPSGSPVYHAIEQSLVHELIPVEGRRRALVILTDGRDNGIFRRVSRGFRSSDGIVPLATPPRIEILQPSEDTLFQRMLEVVSAEHVPVYVVALNTDLNLMRGTAAMDDYVRLLLNDRDQARDYIVGVRNRLEKVAEASSGRILFPNNFENIVPLYTQIGQDLGKVYSIGYVSNLSKDQHGFREIKITTKDQSLHVVQTRTGYTTP